jgi:hypothetical protein
MTLSIVRLEMGFQVTQRIYSQRLQIDARCWLIRTGAFFNIVAISSFICCSFEFVVVPARGNGGANSSRVRAEWKSTVDQEVNCPETGWGSARRRLKVVLY